MKKDAHQLRIAWLKKRVLSPKKCIYRDATEKVQLLFSQSSQANNSLFSLSIKEEEKIENIVPYVIADHFDDVCRFFFSYSFSKKKIVNVFFKNFFISFHNKGYYFSAKEKSMIFLEDVFLSFLYQFQENIFLSFLTIYRLYQYENILENREKIITHAYDFFIKNHNALRARNFSVPLYAQRHLVVSFFIKKILQMHFIDEFIKKRIFVKEKKIVSILLHSASCVENIAQIWHNFCEIFLHDFNVFNIPHRLLRAHLFCSLEKNLSNKKLFQIFKNNLLCAKKETSIQKHRSFFEKIMTDETVSLQERCTVFKNLAQQLLDHVYAEFGLAGEQKIDFLKKIYQTLMTYHATDLFFARAIYSVLWQQKNTALPANRDTLLHQASVLAAHFSFLPPTFVVYNWLLWHCTRQKNPPSVAIPIDTLICFSMYYLCLEKYDVSLVDNRCFFSFATTYLSLEKMHDFQNMIHAVYTYYHQEGIIDIFPHFTNFICRIAKNDPGFFTQATRKIAALERCMTYQILERVCKESTILVDIKGLFSRDEPFLSMHLTQLDCAMRAYLEKSCALLQQKNLVFSQDALFQYVWSYLMEDIHTYDKEEIIKSIYRGIVMKCAEEYGTLLQDFCQKNFVFDDTRHYVYDGVIRSFYANVHHCTAALGLGILPERDIDRLSCDHL